jgi:hypothetical protein
LGAVFVLPITLLFGSELFANNFSENFQSQISQEKLLACGGGGGGASPAAKKAKRAKQAKAKLSFKKRQLAKKAAAGEPTDQLQAEIKELESLLSE